MKTIRWKMKALRQLRRIRDSRTREKIYDSAEGLRTFPDCRNVKKLKVRDAFRLRVGQWRIVFTESPEIIEIEEVQRRNGHTY